MRKLLLLFLIFLSACTVPAQKIDNTNSLDGLLYTAENKTLPQEVKVPILIYHHVREAKPTDSQNDRTYIVSPAAFEEQMKFLKDNDFNTITFKNLTDYFYGGFEMPEKPVILSFDDGVINQYENAWPILKSNNQKATFFIFTNPISKSKNYMTWEQLQEMVDFGMEIGSHTRYHQFLTRTTEDLEKEILGSKQTIEENLNTTVDTLAYPFGEFDNATIELTKKYGYKAARGIFNGVIHTPQDLFKLDGYFITENFSRFKNIITK